MTINEMIAKYKIVLAEGGAINVRGKVTPQEVANLKAAKADIITELIIRDEANKKAIKEAAERLSMNVPGLEALRLIRNEWETYSYKYSRYIDNGALGEAPVKPSVESSVVATQYPVAAAYLKAESFEMASNYAKSAAGQKAKQRIANGEDYIIALAEMEAEWTQHAKENMWN
jgi:hypothetical protein